MRARDYIAKLHGSLFWCVILLLWASRRIQVFVKRPFEKIYYVVVRTLFRMLFFFSNLTFDED